MNSGNEQFYRVLKKHYILKMSQKEVAENEGLSTATVSRMINRAVSEGYVKYELNLPTLSVFELEEEIKQRFGLGIVSVSKVDLEEKEVIERDVAIAVCNYLNALLQPGDVMGVAWGNTLAAIVRYLKPKRIDRFTVVGLNGGVTRNTISYGAEMVVGGIAANYGGEGYMLPVPSVVDSSEVANILRNDSQIQEIFELIQKVNVALFTVGNIREDSILIRSGYFTGKEYQQMREKGYVGDICSRYFYRDGSHPDQELYQRTMAISLEDLARVEKKICVVMDSDKAEGLYGALKGGYVSQLFIDELTARALLDISDVA